MMKEKIAYIGIENACQVKTQNDTRDSEPRPFSILDKIVVNRNFRDLWISLNDDEKSYVKTLLHEEQKRAEQERESDHLYVYNKTLRVIEENQSHH